MAKGVQFTEEGARRIKAAVEKVERTNQSGGNRRYRRNPIVSGGVSFFLARIDDFAVLGPNRWAYGFTSVYFLAAGGVAVNPDGPTQTATGDYPALNLFEINNTGSNVEGNSVNVSGTSYPDGFELQPVGGRQSFDSGDPGYLLTGNNVIVQMWTTSDDAGEAVYFFDYNNADDGTCT